MSAGPTTPPDRSSSNHPLPSYYITYWVIAMRHDVFVWGCFVIMVVFIFPQDQAFAREVGNSELNLSSKSISLSG
jgi:hypothetical protein